LPKNQRQRRTCYALCHILYPVSAALASFFRMDSISISFSHQQVCGRSPGRARLGRREVICVHQRCRAMRSMVLVRRWACALAGKNAPCFTPARPATCALPPRLHGVHAVLKLCVKKACLPCSPPSPGLVMGLLSLRSPIVDIQMVKKRFGPL
jgi:hypothetical protein